MKKEPSYESKVFTFLDRMEAGTMSLTKLCTPETRDKFVAVVKLYIIERGVFNGYCTEFDSNMTAIKKWDIILRTPRDKLMEAIKNTPNSKIVTPAVRKAKSSTKGFVTMEEDENDLE